MDTRSFMLAIGCAALLLCLAACVSDEVLYVDEHGNEIAGDPEGTPADAPTGAPGEAPFVPYEVPMAPTAAGAAPDPVRLPESRLEARPAAAKSKPAKPASWDLPPAGAAPSPLEGADAQPQVNDVKVRKPVKPSPKIFAPAPAPESPAPRAPAKKVESSAGLDLPPAG